MDSTNNMSIDEILKDSNRFSNTRFKCVHVGGGIYKFAVDGLFKKQAEKKNYSVLSVTPSLSASVIYKKIRKRGYMSLNEAFQLSKVVVNE